MMLLMLAGISMLWPSYVRAFPGVDRRLAVAQNSSTSSKLAPWEKWRVCNGKWRCEVGCFQEAAQECIDLPSYSQLREGIQDTLQQECDERDGTWGRVCDCTCTESLDCKQGCFDVHLNKCDMDIIEEKCFDWRRRGPPMLVWIDECKCTEVVQYFTRFAENVSFVTRAGASGQKPAAAVLVAAVSLFSAAVLPPMS
mmetsp:Transcript_32070/g.75235  ORF Transcript_32070/g.75235 Transcript_32070/m.75235 type:complete len:197 (-) Transcript_32070:154-744(-)